MAGVNMAGDEGVSVGTQTVPAIGGIEGRSGMTSEAQTSQVVASAHLTDEPRANGVAYPETPGVQLDTSAYPEGTQAGKNTN
jgi:hypothetical protein